MKKFFLKLFKIYTEEEVKDMFAKVQYEMPQHIIGNRDQMIIPLDFFKEYSKKRDVSMLLKKRK